MEKYSESLNFKKRAMEWQLLGKTAICTAVAISFNNKGSSKKKNHRLWPQALLSDGDLTILKALNYYKPQNLLLVVK